MEFLHGIQRDVQLPFYAVKQMSSIAKGVNELRVMDSQSWYRTFYYQKHEKGILVFHAFNKKSNKTPTKEIETGRRRFKELLQAIEKEI